jgi:ADP-ribosylation factor GTPase-activating protein 2/3
VVVEDAVDASEGSGTNTPAGEPDDFFSSWDKPSIKRPSNPPSRSGTPGINRTASPFLGANGNGPARSKSPLTSGEPAPPAAPRTTSTAALRKTTTSSKPKSNILGAKKNKLGVKKVDASLLDFDEAEKKAREEAERKERLGYDPDEDAAPAEVKIVAAQPETPAPTLFQPTPMGVPPRPKGDYGSGSSRARDEEMERLNTSTRKRGFGQIGGGAAKAAAPKAKTMGFGSTTRAPVEGMSINLEDTLYCPGAKH